MRHSSITLFILIIQLVLFSGCQCREHQTGKYQFTSKELEINPYNINDRFFLKNLSGDSVEYFVSNRNSSMEKDFGNSDEYQCDYELYELNVTSIDSKDNLWKFTITLSSHPVLYDTIYYKGIGFSQYTYSNQSNKSMASIGLTYNNNSLYDKYYYGTKLLFHKNISLGPKSFIDIYEIILFQANYGTNLYAKKIFYSIKLGIVGFTTNENETWYLNK